MAHTGEADHLRRLLDIQPACLLRVRRDSIVLACNDAGLSLLGYQHLAEAIDRNLADWLDQESRQPWSQFVERVWAEGSGSLECRLVQTGAEPRAGLFKAMALHDHPDGFESMLLSARDNSSLERLEQVLEDVATRDRKEANVSERMTALESDFRRVKEENKRLVEEAVARE